MDSKDKFILALAVLGSIIICLLVGVLYAPVRAQEPCQLGDFGCDHESFHGTGFYPALKRDKDGFGCCNDTDCRPTSLRIVNGEYEVLIDREWVVVEADKIATPKGGHPAEVTSIAHVCATRQKYVYCFTPPALQ